MNKKTLFQTIQEAGIEFDSHRSDLYLPVNDQVKEILSRFPLQEKNAIRFISNTDQKPMFDIPFAYDPFWEKRM